MTTNLPCSTWSPPKIDFVFLRDQIPLNAEELAMANEIAFGIQHLLDVREEHVRQQCLDPEVYMPQANWKTESGFQASSRELLAGNPAALNGLRLLSQSFTGFRLLDMSTAAGKDILSEVPHGVDEGLAEIAKHPDVWVSRYIAMAAKLPSLWHISPPARFGEVGWLIYGKLINHDTVVYLERMALLREAMMPDPSGYLQLPENRPARILEIGGGYGGLAHHLKTLLPDAYYYIVDLPESLSFSAIYLSILWQHQLNTLLEPKTAATILVRKDPGFTFIPNYLFPLLAASGEKFDLVVNSLSMSEMNAKQVREYAAAIAGMLRPTGGFFEQNQDNREFGHLNASEVIAEYFPRPRTLTGHFVPNGLTEGLPHLWTRSEESGGIKAQNPITATRPAGFE